MSRILSANGQPVARPKSPVMPNEAYEVPRYLYDLAYYLMTSVNPNTNYGDPLVFARMSDLGTPVYTTYALMKEKATPVEGTAEQTNEA